MHQSRFLFCGLFILMAMPVRAQAPSLSVPAVEMSEFGALADSGQDATPAVCQALESCKATKASGLAFKPGRYDFWKNRACRNALPCKRGALHKPSGTDNRQKKKQP